MPCSELTVLVAMKSDQWYGFVAPLRSFPRLYVQRYKVCTADMALAEGEGDGVAQIWVIVESRYEFFYI